MNSADTFIVTIKKKLCLHFVSGGIIFSTSPTGGTVLIDLNPDDPEYISVEEQVSGVGFQLWIAIDLIISMGNKIEE